MVFSMIVCSTIFSVQHFSGRPYMPGVGCQIADAPPLDFVTFDKQLSIVRS
jgi:hypothetical protein